LFKGGNLSTFGIEVRAKGSINKAGLHSIEFIIDDFKESVKAGYFKLIIILQLFEIH